ncbi:MAG: GspH/FimT family pseudopilin [Deltaproteobacteria bacterium]|nr:MAG: GspH/FimT family pseudopilin [Deltaproteobacteria bacterium]
MNLRVQSAHESSHQLGFTIAEMMIIVAILAFVAAFALPNMSEWTANFRLNSAVRDLVANLQYAKMEAARKNLNCTITFKQPIGLETYDCVVYLDSDKDLEYDATEQLLKTIELSSYKGVEFDTSRGTNSGVDFVDNDEGYPSIAFSWRGLPLDNAGATGAGSIYIKNILNKKKTIQVGAAGSISVQ